MQLLKSIFIAIWKSWFVLMNAVSLPFIVPICAFWLMLGKHKHDAFYQTERLWAKFVFYMGGFYFEKDLLPQELDPNQPYIIVSNHTSTLDIVIIFMLHPNNEIVFVGKSTVKKFPLLGYVFKKAHILVDRKNRESRAQVYDAAKQKIEEGKSICIFPEGGVPDESIQLREFKDGAFAIAIEHQIPLVIYTFGDVKRRFPEPFLKGCPGKIRVKQHAVIETKGLERKDIKDLKERVYNTILNQVQIFEKE